MRALALVLLLVGGSSLAGSGQAVSPTRKNRTHNQGAVTKPLFEFAPANGAGMGTACACTAVTGRDGEAVVFSRSSPGTCLKTVGIAPQLIATGDLVTCAANQPRVMAGTDGTSVLGQLIEGAGANVAWYSEQIDNPVWSPANAGVAAPIVTANAVNGPCGAPSSTCGMAERVQIPATTSGQYSFVYQSTAIVNPASGFILARGNGMSNTTDLAFFGLGGWHAVNCSYVPTGWTLCLDENFGDVTGGAGAIGFGNFSGLALTGSGDRAAQDFFITSVQLEHGAAASSYMVSAGANGTRSAEPTPYVTLSTPISGPVSIAASFIAPVAGHAYGDGILGLSASAAPTTPGISIQYDATGNAAPPYSAVLPAGMGCYRQVGDLVGYTQDTDGLGGTQSNIGRVWCASSGGAANDLFYGQLAPFYTTASRGFALASSNVVTIGGWSTAAPVIGGVIKLVCADPTRCVGGKIGAVKVAWDGDSIIYGFPNPPTSPAVQLTQLLGPQGKTVTNGGINASTTDECATRWTDLFQGQGYSTLVWSCAVNDIATGNTGSATAATVETTLAAALADGEKVIVTGVMPWKGSSQWSSGKNTEGHTYNTLISAWAGSHGATFVDTSSMGGQGGDPDVLLNIYNSGDYVHPTVAGQHELAVRVQAANP